ncbi:MAG: hypothetical protein ACOYJ6_02395 [Caulobacterales bacterium]
MRGAVNNPHADAMRLHGFEIENRAIGRANKSGSGIDQEAAAGIVKQAVSQPLISVRIVGCHQRHANAACAVFQHRPQPLRCGRGNRFIDIIQANLDNNSLFVEALRGLDGQHVAALIFEVQRIPRDADLAGDLVDLEAAIRVINKAERYAHRRFWSGRQEVDQTSADGCVFVDTHQQGVNLDRRLVNV